MFFNYFSKHFFSRTFQDSPVYSSTFQSCANPGVLCGLFHKSKEEGKDQDLIQSSTTPDTGTTWESEKNTRKHHIQESQEASPFPAGNLFVCLFCCFASQVNSYGHGGTVSSPNHTFSWAGLNKRLTSNSCAYFRL